MIKQLQFRVLSHAQSWVKKTWVKRVPLGVAALMLASAGTISAEPNGWPHVSDYLPLAPGNSWTYQDASTGSTFKVDVSAVQYFMKGYVYHRLRGYTPKPVLVRVNEWGNIVYWDEELQAEVMLTAFETGFGGWFHAGGRQCPEEGQAQATRVPHDGPAGRWHTLPILYRSFACADAGTISEQFVENIGMVRRVENTIAGPRTYNLVHAQVGTQSITAGSRGSFTVSAVPKPGFGEWNVTLRAEKSLGDSMKLHFLSSQEFDLRLRDENGQILWTWSADKLFLAAAHERDLSGEWSESVIVPTPPGVPEIRRVLILEAWITNVEGEQKFAAATTVDIPGIAPASNPVQ